MSDIKDSGPAFPEIGRTFDNDSQEHIYCSIGGMTLRDYFAAKAMAAFIGNTQFGHLVDLPHTAEGAYKMADAMLRARGAA